MAALFPFEVFTPSRLFYSDPVEAVILTLIDGEAGIYANHTPFTAPVSSCILKIKAKDGKWKSAFIAEGFLEVKIRKTVLVCDAAEWPEEIDLERAEAAKKRAEEILSGDALKFEAQSAAASLARAAMRLKAAAEGQS